MPSARHQNSPASSRHHYLLTSPSPSTDWGSPGSKPSPYLTVSSKTIQVDTEQASDWGAPSQPGVWAIWQPHPLCPHRWQGQEGSLAPSTVLMGTVAWAGTHRVHMVAETVQEQPKTQVENL